MNRHSFPTATLTLTLALPLLAALALSCNREPPREPPPAASPPPPPVTPPAAAEPAVAPLPEEKQEAEGAPAKESAADRGPMAPAAAPPASTRAKPKASAAPKAKADRPAAGQDSLEFGLDEAHPDGSLLRQRLQKALQQATPDCPSARSRKQAICDLAHQICQMVDRDPEIASVEAYCTDAKQRCSEAAQRTAERCK